MEFTHEVFDLCWSLLDPQWRRDSSAFFALCAEKVRYVSIGILDFFRWLFGGILRAVATPFVKVPIAFGQDAPSTSRTDFLAGVLDFFRWCFGPIHRRWFKGGVSKVEPLQPTQLALFPGEVVAEEVQPEPKVRKPRTGHPLAFRPDLWRDGAGSPIAMDEEIISLQRPFLSLVVDREKVQQKAPTATFTGLLFQEVELHFDSKMLTFSNRWFRDKIGTSWRIYLVDIVSAESLDVSGIWAEWLGGVLVIKLTVKGYSEPKILVIPNHGLWWPVNINKPQGARLKPGQSAEEVFMMLKKWAATGKWT